MNATSLLVNSLKIRKSLKADFLTLPKTCFYRKDGSYESNFHSGMGVLCEYLITNKLDEVQMIECSTEFPDIIWNDRYYEIKSYRITEGDKYMNSTIIRGTNKYDFDKFKEQTTTVIMLGWKPIPTYYNDNLYQVEIQEISGFTIPKNFEDDNLMGVPYEKLITVQKMLDRKNMSLKPIKNHYDDRKKNFYENAYKKFKFYKMGGN